MKEPPFFPLTLRVCEYVDSKSEGQGHTVIEHAGRQRLTPYSSHVLILVAPSASSNTEFKSEDAPDKRV